MKGESGGGGKARVEVVLVGGLAERRGARHEVEVPPEARLRDVLRLLKSIAPEAFTGDGDKVEPAPGILVFVDGVDYRILGPDHPVRPGTRIHVVQVYHGG